MLQEVKKLQNNAVTKLINLIRKNTDQTVFTFKAPTGSGKTYMMADFMNRIISENENIIFIVSALSKSKLAEQNYESFKHDSENGTFQKLNPYLINSESNGEGSLFIPTDYNVYVLPTDLYKETSKLKSEGVFLHFLQDITPNLFNGKNGKTIYLIKDEAHRATKNIDKTAYENFTPFFSKIINFTATPDKNKKQIPDVEITNLEAEEAKLIKKVEFGSEEDTLEDAVNKFLEIKDYYSKLISKINPCLIIQISNTSKGENELEKIVRLFEKHQSLKYVYISKSDKDYKTNDKMLNLPRSKWYGYMKNNESTIDVIIFKMVITEGWDIPRACMLYQIRDSKSKMLDEQVMGRVRRNPRLLDFETLSKEAQELATTAWIWGLVPKTFDNTIPVSLVKNCNIEESIRVKTTRLQDVSATKSFDTEAIIRKLKDNSKLAPKTIFEKYKSLIHQNNEVQDLCYNYSDSFYKWRVFTDNLSQIKRTFDEYVCNYQKSMVLDEEVSFPVDSCYVKTDYSVDELDEWIWCIKERKAGDEFSFDSEAEKKWARILEKMQNKVIQEIDTEKFLWGKNFPYNSKIKFEYYLDGIHASYPDFVLKDKYGRIHIFEVKSLNKSSNISLNSDEYEEKIEALQKCYEECANKTGHIFYIPIMTDSNENPWTIWKYEKGKENDNPLSIEEFRDFIKSPPVDECKIQYKINPNYGNQKVASNTDSL